MRCSEPAKLIERHLKGRYAVGRLRRPTLTTAIAQRLLGEIDGDRPAVFVLSNFRRGDQWEYVPATGGIAADGKCPW
jgi:hypothetical protein